MAGTGVDNYSYILLKDTQGEKAARKIMSAFGSGSKTVQVLRGELFTLIPRREVQPRNDEKPAHNYRLKKDSSVTLYCGEDDLAPLNKDDLELLEAIQKPFNRFVVFSDDYKLEWGGKLKMGDRVYVKIPSHNSSVPEWSIAVVQYVGPVESLPGRNFGVEIKDPRYRGRGSTDGFFQAYQYFNCEDYCGLFVSLEKLSVKPSPQAAAQQQLLSTPKRSSALPPRGTSQPTLHPGSNSSQGVTSSLDIDHRVLEMSCFKTCERVAVYNKKGKPVYGTYRWSGTDVQTRKLESLHIRIETDDKVYTTDFPKAVPGMSHLFHAEQWHHLVVPTEFVYRAYEVLPSEGRKQDSVAKNKGNVDLADPVSVARTFGTTERQLQVEQIKILKDSEQRKKKEDKAREIKAKKITGANNPELEQVRGAIGEYHIKEN